jgi:hypothetical protein
VKTRITISKAKTRGVIDNMQPDGFHAEEATVTGTNLDQLRWEEAEQRQLKDDANGGDICDSIS